MDVQIDFNLDDTPPSLGALLRRWGAAEQTHEPVVLDLRACRYLGPLAVGFLAATHRQWLADARDLRVLPPDEAQRALRGFCRFSGLSELLGWDAGPDSDHPKNVTTPLVVFQERDHKAVEQVCALVRRFVDMDQDTADVLRTLALELVQNVVDHAQGPGVLSARMFKDRREVRVAVVDRGRGLRKALAENYVVRDDRHALKLALEEGGSSRSTTHNRGQGLTLLDELIRNNGGNFLLASASCYYFRQGRRTEYQPLPARLPGTLCLFTFKVDHALHRSADHADDIW